MQENTIGWHIILTKLLPFLFDIFQDYMDAFEKCLRLGLKGGREREIVHVLLDCCMQEKEFNPYYAYLATKFCQFERKFKVSIRALQGITY